MDTIRIFHKGKRSGHWTINHPNGKPHIEKSYYNNNLDGEYKEFYPSGQVKVHGFYKDGQPTGEWKYYDEQGNLTETKKHG